LDVDINGDEWRLFKTQEAKTPSYWVALKKSVLRQRMFDILDVRDRMGLQIYPILILYIIFLTLAISYAALRPIRNMQQLFSKIDIKDTHSDAHLQTKNTYRELASFLNYFNELIDRSRLSYQQANRFSSDASHELKTPLTIIRGHLQRLINRSKDGSDDQIQLSLVMDEVERLISITNKLLMLSQADAGRLASSKESFQFNNLVDHLVDDYSNYRPDIEITKTLQKNIELVGDKDLITQLILNLFSNAFKYNYSGGKVIFIASCNATHLIFTISNTTHLSAAGLDARVFERFYRHLGSNTNETNTQQGSGLGLSLCREIAIAHGGELEIRPVVDQTVTFSCRLSLKGIK
jgi:signal transduction histidine kinase